MFNSVKTDHIYVTLEQIAYSTVQTGYSALYMHTYTWCNCPIYKALYSNIAIFAAVHVCWRSIHTHWCTHHIYIYFRTCGQKPRCRSYIHDMPFYSVYMDGDSLYMLCTRRSSVSRVIDGGGEASCLYLMCCGAPENYSRHGAAQKCFWCSVQFMFYMYAVTLPSSSYYN